MCNVTLLFSRSGWRSFDASLPPSPGASAVTRLLQLSSHHDEKASVLAAGDEHLQLARQPVEARAERMSLEERLVLARLGVADRRNAGDEFDAVVIEPAQHLV